MMRERIKPGRGKFFLTIKMRYGVQYYRESGVFDAGTDHEEPFLYWTKYREYAFGFMTVKTARAMAARLLAEHGIRAVIVNREGMVI